MTPLVSALTAAAVSVRVLMPEQVSFSFPALCPRMQGAPVEDVMVTPCKYRETASESAVGSTTLTRICPSVMVPSTV